MQWTVWSLMLILGVCASISAQGTSPSKCPTISVTGPAGIVKEGDVAYYMANIGNAAKNHDLEFVWSISTGTISEGQGTTRIGIIQNGLSQTVTVEVKGLPSGCPNIASESAPCGLRPPEPEKVVQFSEPLSPISNEKFKKIAEAAGNNPNAQLYIFVPPDAAVRSAFSERLQNVNAAPKVNLARITFVENSSRNSTIQVWLVPPGATPPSKCDGCEQPAPAPTTNCPTLEISGPAGTTPAGNIMPFVVLVSEPRMRNLSFAWTTSAGTIVEGQGMRVVKIKAPAGKAKVDLTASVRITGLPQGCQNTASATRPVAGM